VKRGRLLALLLAAGCGARSWPQTERCSAHEGTDKLAVSSFDPWDVLFVIDDGPSMALEQTALARELPDMVRAMTDGVTGTRELPPIGSLHVGVISSDLGLGSATSESSCSAFGDDGVLRRPESCGTDDAPFVWHFNGYHDSAQTNAAVSCCANLGADGCAISQPLEAVLKAITPSGHGETGNRGFLRSVSAVLVVLITDKDDCSLSDPSRSNATVTEAHCAEGSAVSAVSRYVTKLREIHEGLVDVAIIAGLPPDLEADEAQQVTLTSYEDQPDAYYDRVLADPRMQSGSPSCVGAGASAVAPRRLTQFAKEFGSGASVTSICRADWKRALFQHSERICTLRGPWQLTHELGVEDEHSTCRMTWELPLEVEPEQPLTPARCSDRPEFLNTPAPEFPQVSERGRTLCEVRRAPYAEDSDGRVVVDGEGFYTPPALELNARKSGAYDVEFTEHAKPPNGVTVRLTCTMSECDE
jgi:hypothetical protein